MDVLERLRKLLQERGWSEYRLAQVSGLNESTISNIYRRNTLPTIPTLEAICKAFGITLSQFFAESDMVEMTPDVKELLDTWVSLTPEQKRIVLQVAKSYHQDI
ncbi:helix-turn-helix domain-containing protein [Subdoligranulum variabile]|uniref:DNA-binding helix-turn-helix protein n=1 Tax=Subdoligranulum variabile DSM 15176 TaxID=411471 RepID=D1PQA9_9FIRM|nr:helix-turn-helix domain-containing protein [Subdoligranulum variabile]EFB75116.1 DNA-binding helix-turn-helix protein [Subdoligranulum variabile DSM 15176]UWP66906.1 helix-turn-helix domain-containing protein [Subdoligranulum variabile]